MLTHTRNVSAIIVSFRTGAVLFECIESVLAQPEVDEVIIVDNGNPLHDSNRLLDLGQKNDRVTVVNPGRNTGFAAGCNLGVAHASGEFIALVNPDCEIEPNTVGRVLRVFDAKPDAWVCGCRLINPDGSEQRGGRRDVLTPWHAVVEVLKLYRLFPNHPTFRRFHLYEAGPILDEKVVPTVSGAFMVIRRVHYQRLGGMDDNMFLHVDDSDFCLRVAALGGNVYYCGHIDVIHHRSTSDVSKTFVLWHKTRSMNYYFYKHFSLTYPRWFLHFGAAALWGQFLFSLPKLLIVDIPRAFGSGSSSGGVATPTPAKDSSL